MRYDQARWHSEDVFEPLLSEKGLTEVEVESSLPDGLTRDSLALPDVSEPELARHYTRLSQMNYGVDSGPYPLGSCTMKYNPKFTEDVAAARDAAVHPSRESSAQGCLELMYRLQRRLAVVGGVDAVSLQPPAGAAGEFTGILMTRAFHRDRGESRGEIVVPDTAHGTNFASAAMAGFDVVRVPSDDDGCVDLDALEQAVGDETALFMVTNPNTLGVFERDVGDVADVVHDAGGLMYYDGANLNALLGRARPGDMGFDVMHFNLHKTFATPHGGGGPGAGPVGACGDLVDYLPSPHVRESDGGFEFYEPERSIGRVHGFHGNWLALVKAYAYVVRLGDAGLRAASEAAVLNANYLAESIDLDVPFAPFHHEFVASADGDALEFARGLLDFGVHPPTTKWPEIVDEALMTEPTESESRASLDAVAEAFDAVAAMSEDELGDAPRRTSSRRVDQVRAAREPVLSWWEL
ncbi:MAG: aminomethyl-transferring glycine dehydrogenase subunit GcvPB [Halobacteriales archaeon]